MIIYSDKDGVYIDFDGKIIDKTIDMGYASYNNQDLIYNRRLEEAKELLKFIKETLDGMTTEEFAFGADKEIRNKIDEFLGTENG